MKQKETAEGWDNLADTPEEFDVAIKNSVSKKMKESSLKSSDIRFFKKQPSAMMCS